MSEAKDGCAAPAQGPIVSAGEGSGSEGIRSANGGGTAPEGGRMNQARVGRPAPDFEATAFEKGGFRNIRLSEFAGRWVVLCFYPGDFTFV